MGWVVEIPSLSVFYFLNIVTYYFTIQLTINPSLAKEWHPTRNGTLTPVDVHLIRTGKYGGCARKDTSGKQIR
jgi:hypothetical protein